jgi:hypothetical protein
LNEYNEGDRERKAMSGTRSDKDSDMAGQGQGQDRKIQGLERTRSGRTRQEEVNRTRTRQVKVRDKIVKDLAKKI